MCVWERERVLGACVCVVMRSRTQIAAIASQLQGLIQHGSMPIHKLILMGPPPEITALRPLLQEYVGMRATLTQAQADMVEVRLRGGFEGFGDGWMDG